MQVLGQPPEGTIHVYVLPNTEQDQHTHIATQSKRHQRFAIYVDTCHY